jgi:hypothetical protein
MYIRCFKCKGVTWVGSGAEPSTGLPCRGCNQQLLIKNTLGTEDTSLVEDAARFAEASQIDLPSANSVLLGVMELKDALSIQGQRSLEPKTASALDLAAEEALRELEAAQAKRVRPTKPRRRLLKLEPLNSGEPRSLALPLLSLAVAVAVVGLVGWSNWKREVGVAKQVAARHRQTKLATNALRAEGVAAEDVRVSFAAKIRRDRIGRVVQIVGKNPEAVLRAFCERGSATTRFDPLELTSMRPDRIGARLGVLRNFDDLGSNYAIAIQRRPSDRLWVAGDGSRPLQPFVLEPERVGDLKIPLSESKPTAKPG